MSRLRDELRDEPSQIGAPSKLPIVLERLGDEADDFLELLADRTTNLAALWRRLVARGIDDVEETTVRYWAKKERAKARGQS